MELFDPLVVGSGPAGEKGAAQAAYFGKRVALIERRGEPDGAGLNTGTAPSKTLRESALYFSGLRQGGLYGIYHSSREGLTVGGSYLKFNLADSCSSPWTTRSGSNSHGSNILFGSRCTQAVRRPQAFAPITSKGLLEIMQTISFSACTWAARYS